MNFSKSHFINELKKTNDALHESISNSLDSTNINEAKSEDWDDVDTLQDFSVLISKIVKGVLPNLVKLKPKTKKEFEKLLAAFKNGLDDISESNVNEATPIRPKQLTQRDAVGRDVHKLVNGFVKKMADKYGYSLQDAVYAIMRVLRSQNYDGLNEATDSLGHPSRIKLRDPETAKLNRINALYDAYMNLAKHMESSGASQDKIDTMKTKASDLMTHVKDM